MAQGLLPGSPHAREPGTPHIQYHNPEPPQAGLPEDFSLKEDVGLPCYLLFRGETFENSENFKLFQTKL